MSDEGTIFNHSRFEDNEEKAKADFLEVLDGLRKDVVDGKIKFMMVGGMYDNTDLLALGMLPPGTPLKHFLAAAEHLMNSFAPAFNPEGQPKEAKDESGN